MELLVDQQEQAPQLAEGCHNFGELFKAVEDNLLQERRLIGAMEVLQPDGNVFELNPTEIAGLSLEEVGKAVFTSISLKEFAEQEVGATGRFLPVGIEGLQRVSELFNARDYAGALSLFSELVEGLRMFLIALNSIQDAFGLSLNDIQETPTTTIGQSVDNLNQILGDMMDGLENQDYVLVNDYLTYELIPHLNDWQKRLQTILEAIP